MPPTASRSFRFTQRHEYQPISRHFAFAGATAVLLALAFPQPGWSLLAHVALVPLVLLALRAANPWRLAWTTYLVSLVWWLIMIRWMYPVTVGGTIGLSAYMAVYLPLFALLVRFLHRRYRRAAMVIAVPAVWVSLEIIRCQWLQGGFAWFALGHSQMPLPPDFAPPAPPGSVSQAAMSYAGASRLVQIADLFGQYGVSFLVAMTNGLIVDVLAQPWVQFSHPRGTGDETLVIAGPGVPIRPRSNRTLTAAIAFWLIVMACALAYGQVRLSFDSVAQPRLQVAVIQTNVPQNNKDHPSFDQIISDWKRMVDLSIAAARSQPRPAMIAWPETMVPAGLNPEAIAHYTTAQTSQHGDEIFHRQIQELARGLNCWFLVGADALYDWQIIQSPDKTQSFEVPGRRFNSVYLYRPDGSQVDQRYDKIHRVPFGEYIPWVEEADWLKALFLRYISPYDFDYTIQPGRSLTVFTGPPATVGNPASASRTPVRIATPICFEDVYPDLVRKLAYAPGGAKRVDLLANLTNDAWFLFRYDAPWLHHWFTQPVAGLVSWLGASYQARQELQSAAFRCVENRLPMVRCVNTGVSGMIASSGRIGPVLRVDGRTTSVDGFVAAEVVFDPRVTVFGFAGPWLSATLQMLTALWILGGFLRPDKMDDHSRR